MMPINRWAWRITGCAVGVCFALLAIAIHPGIMVVVCGAAGLFLAELTRP